MINQSLLFDESLEINSPRELEIKEINPKVAVRLNNLYHSRLPKIPVSNILRNTHYICYGLFYGSKAIGVAIWSSPVAQNRFDNGKEILELRRLALNNECPKNTASWCIGRMVKLIRLKFPDIKRLISYQDTDVHQGIIYKASNWVIGGETGFISWSTAKRERNEDQATGDKIRWEYYL